MNSDERDPGFQFYCPRHDYGWNINEDGIDSGCVHCVQTIKDQENPHGSDCGVWSGDDCDCAFGKNLDDYEPPHYTGCICADCSGAELTARND